MKSYHIPGEEDSAAIAELQEQSFIRAEGWQEALEAAVLAGCLPRNEVEMPFQTEHLDETIIRYPSHTVITAVYPSLHTIAQEAWMMIWPIDSKRQYADGYRF